MSELIGVKSWRDYKLTTDSLKQEALIFDRIFATPFDKFRYSEMSRERNYQIQSEIDWLEERGIVGIPRVDVNNAEETGAVLNNIVEEYIALSKNMDQIISSAAKEILSRHDIPLDKKLTKEQNDLGLRELANALNSSKDYLEKAGDLGQFAQRLLCSDLRKQGLIAYPILHSDLKTIKMTLTNKTCYRLSLNRCLSLTTQFLGNKSLTTARIRTVEASG